MMIVWRVRGKISRSVLCSIVCNSHVPCSAHTHIWTDLTVVCWLGLAFLWLYCVSQFVYVCVIVYLCMCAFCSVRFNLFGTMPRDWLGRTSQKWPILCRVGRETLTQSINKFFLLLFQNGTIGMSDTSLYGSYVLSVTQLSSVKSLKERQSTDPN